ncbi:hypothetical protein IQ06DRAFT_262434 [Phaeosphaeriaceae sp. SRC1lsM3a]|nr:hypothetical protein IQ06DRAFT_262434 [Stagonospora sp. SRC1lsM3a]
MSVSARSNNSQQLSSFQPFQCTVCQSRFTRLENLKRHAALHSRSQDEASLACNICQVTFSRPDLRLRHLKRKHPDHEEEQQQSRKRKRVPESRDRLHDDTETSPTASLTESRHDSHNQGSDGEDDEAVLSGGDSHHYHHHRQSMSSADDDKCQPNSLEQQLLTRRSKHAEEGFEDSPVLEPSSLLLASFLDPHGNLPSGPVQSTIAQPPFNTTIQGFSFDQWSPERLSSFDITQLQADQFLSADEIAHGCSLFFRRCSAFLPVLHQPTFDATQVPRYLLLSILCLAYQHGNTLSSDDPETSLDVSLSVRCFQHARALIAIEEEERADQVLDATSLVQTYLFLQIYAMMYSDSDDSAYGLKTHSKMIALARAGGLLQSTRTDSVTTEDLGSLWRHFVRDEQRKRTAFAIHQIDTLWYQTLSIPRSLSHLEVKHELPCPEDYWTASSASEWAHKQLVSRHITPPLQFSDAIRRMVSTSGQLGEIPSFDPYGAINMTQFLTSSAREISGWSTMTGMLSMDRLEPIRASLLALGTVIGAPQSTSSASAPCQMGLFESTWEAAMIEMQMWSPTHTGGIVARSLDAALNQLTHFAPSSEFLCEANVAGAVQPHVDWFLRYLDETRDLVFSEAPWLVLYAWKAFMIAWQLIKGGVPGAMQAIGIEDGDVKSALGWAKEAFSRRRMWKLGRSVSTCIDSLVE